MARIVFISPYLRGGKSAAKLAHRTKYVATREGVELLRDNSAALPASKKQQEYISRLLRSFPETIELSEYAEYIEAPSQKTVTEFIEQVQEQYISEKDGAENFVDYIANRPGAQLHGEHGLWDADGKVPVLQNAIDEVANHEGVVWTPIISLPRPEAERLGYNNSDNWQALISASAGDIAQAYKIPLEHLRWYAAMHEKEKHIHVHMIVFSSVPNEGYLTKQGIRNLKSAFAKQIYCQDMISVYEKQTLHRNTLQNDAEKVMAGLVQKMEVGEVNDQRLEALVTELSSRLESCSGKKVYGYLPPAVKRIVGEIVDELAKDERVAAAYSLWQDMRDEVCGVYSDTLPERIPLSQQKEFKPVRNMVIREVLNMSLLQSAMKENLAATMLREIPASNSHATQRPQSIDATEPNQAQSHTCVIRMLHHMGNIFRENTGSSETYAGMRIDKKRRKQLQDKRLALGHKVDDHEDNKMDQ